MRSPTSPLRHCRVATRPLGDRDALGGLRAGMGPPHGVRRGDGDFDPQPDPWPDGGDRAVSGRCSPPSRTGSSPQGDSTFFRLRNYVDLQYLYCAWGLVTGQRHRRSQSVQRMQPCHSFGSPRAAAAYADHAGPIKAGFVHSSIRSSAICWRTSASLVLCQYSSEILQQPPTMSRRIGATCHFMGRAC